MREIQASDAKTHLARLLDDVERGETLVITRRGRPIARIVSEVGWRQEQIDDAVMRIAVRRKHTGRITVDELRAARGEGWEH